MFKPVQWSIWLGLLALSLVSAVAEASDPTLDSVEVAGEKFLGIGGTYGRWTGPVPWEYNPTNAPAAFSDNNYAIDLIQESMDWWSRVSGIQFEFMGVNPQGDVANVNNDVVTIVWVPGQAAAGLAGPSFSITQQDVINNGFAPYSDGTVRISPDAFADMGSTPADTRNAELGFVRTMAHEVGHLIGFGHSDNPVSIMYANPYNFIPHLRDDDVRGAQALYGPPAFFTPPDLYDVPPLVNNSDVSNIRVIQQSGAVITEFTNADDDLFAFVRLDADANLSGELSAVAVDNTGRIIGESAFDPGACNSQICVRTTAAMFSQLTARSLPGQWAIHIILDGQRLGTVNFDINTTVATFNAPPSSNVRFSKVKGQAPLDVTVTAEVTGDAEGDDASVIFHLPTEGETVVNLGGSSGSTQRTITLTQPGEYILGVDIDDDSVRYDNNQPGFDDAGTGFREIHQKIVTVYEFIPAMLSLGEQINVNASNEIVSLIPSNAGAYRVQVNDPISGVLINRPLFLNDSFDARQVITIPGLGASGTAVGLAAVDINSNLPIIQIKDAASSAPISNVFPLSSNWNLVRVAVLSNLTNPAVGESQPKMSGHGVATLAKRLGDQLMIVQIRDPANNALIRNINPLGFGWSAQDLVSLNNNGTPALGVVATRNDDNLAIIQVRNATDGSLVRNVFPLGIGWSIEEVQVVPDQSGNGVDELAVRMSRDSDGLEIIQMRDAATNALVGNVYPIGAGAGGWTTQGFEYLDNNGQAALAILSRRDSDGQVLVQERNLATGGVIRNLFFLGPPWIASGGMKVLPDFNGNGVSEIAVSVSNTNNNSRLVQVRDGAAGNVIRNFATVP